MYQQVLNLRKGVGHPFVEPQLGVGDDGVLTGNFSQKAGIAISNSSHVPGAPPPPAPPPFTILTSPLDLDLYHELDGIDSWKR